VQNNIKIMKNKNVNNANKLNSSKNLDNKKECNQIISDPLLNFIKNKNYDSEEYFEIILNIINDNKHLFDNLLPKNKKINQIFQKIFKDIPNSIKESLLIYRYINIVYITMKNNKNFNKNILLAKDNETCVIVINNHFDNKLYNVIKREDFYNIFIKNFNKNNIYEKEKLIDIIINKENNKKYSFYYFNDYIKSNTINDTINKINYKIHNWIKIRLKKIKKDYKYNNCILF
jgi:hypothetical protein